MFWFLSISLSPEDSTLIGCFCLSGYFLPVVAVALAVLAKFGPLFLLSLNGRRQSKWLEWGPMVNDPREGSAGHEGEICNIWQREGCMG